MKMLQLLILLAVALPVYAEQPEMWLIPAGQEKQLQEALKPRKGWPKGWQLLGIAVQGGHADVRYRLPSGDGEGIRLQHAPLPNLATETSGFELAPISATLPPEVVEKILFQLGELKDFHWQRLPPDPPPVLPTPHPSPIAPPLTVTPTELPLAEQKTPLTLEVQVMLGLALASLFAWLLLRRR